MNSRLTAVQTATAHRLPWIGVLVLALSHVSLGARPQGRIAIAGQGTVDLGTFPAHEKRTAEFKVTNIGDAPLDITKVRYSCGCATAQATPNRLAPRETARIRVTTIPGSLEGNFEKIAYVESTDPYQPVIKLLFKGKAQPLVTITPSPYVYAGRIATNSPWSETFTLTRNRADVRLGAPKTTAGYKVDVTMSPAGGNGNRDTLDLRLFPTALPGRLKAQVDIPILHPTNHPPLRIVVAAKIGGEAFAIPHRLVLPTDQTSVTRKFRLRLVALEQGRGHRDDVEWPAVDGVHFTPEGRFDRDQLHFTTVFDSLFLLKLAKEKEIVLQIPVEGATPARIQCRAE